MGTSSRIRREQAARRAAGDRDRQKATKRPVNVDPSLRARLRYAFDNSMARGPSALIWYLGALVAFSVLLSAIVVLVLGTGPTSNPITALYNVLLHTIDTGTVAGDTGNTYIVVQLIITFIGIFIFSAFIGVLANAIDNRLQDLRKGRSAVLEQDHTLILGWSESVFTILSELAIANESRSRASVAILADESKVDMEDAIRERVPDMRGTKVVCRTGDPIVVSDLEIVNLQSARSVIVLAPDGPDSDAMVIKTILALERVSGARESGYHIVAEIEDARNMDAARLAGGEATVVIEKGATISRLIVQSSRQSGAAFVYQELLDFAGDEVYMRHDERLVGETYGEALLHYENCTVIGMRDADGDVKLNPPMNTVLTSEDMVVAVAEDDSVLDTATLTNATIDEQAIADGARREDPPEATLVLGYNKRTPAVVAEMGNYVQPGSVVEVVALDPPTQAEFMAKIGPVDHMEVSVRAGDPSDRDLLDTLDLGRFDRVIVMCDAESTNNQRADARVLVTLLHLRDIAERIGGKFTVVSEILDEADRDLANVAQVDDIVVSEQVVSYMLTQISENRDLAEVFEELLRADGSEVYMRHVEDYLTGDKPVNFATLIASARRRGETAFGYRIAAQSNDQSRDFGVCINPAKSDQFTPAAGDRLIVLAED